MNIPIAIPIPLLFPRSAALTVAIVLAVTSVELHAQSLAQILSINGRGEYREIESSNWTGAQEEQTLIQGNYVRTGDYSRMGILFEDRTQIRLNQNTTLLVKDSSLQVNTLRLERGRVWTQSKSLSEDLIMETTAATAAIRGTDWELEVDANDVATITVFSGEVEFFNNFGTVTVFANEQARAQVGVAPVKLIIVNPADRIQWVTAYDVNPLGFIKFNNLNAVALRNQLAASTANSLQQATLLADLSRWTEAEVIFASLQNTGNTDPTLLIGMGLSALYRGEPDQATAWFDQIETTTDALQTELLSLGRIATLIMEEDISGAISALQQMQEEVDVQWSTAALLLSDLYVFAGELDRAQATAAEGVETFTNDSRLYSQLARIELIRDRRELSAQLMTTALERDSESIESQLIRGDISRVEGDANEAKAAFLTAQAINPHDPRGWFGLGVVNTEREETREARLNLEQTLFLQPDGPGYQGELGVLETFNDNIQAAEMAFSRALDSNRNDYVSLTGLGILELKRGRVNRALDAFLRAQIMEPHYARVHVFAAIAYYQNGQVEQALEELARATLLDDKDPLPHFMASIINSDIFQQQLAIKEGQLALEKLPYLKSLNQLANDQQGNANLGQAFSIFGLADWASSYAQESYTPFWAGSHLFLADQYRGVFSQNSELFQGFLTDPTVFGASNRAQTLLQKPGHHFSLGLRSEESDDLKADVGVFSLNGYMNDVRPLSYFLSVTPLDLETEVDGVEGRIKGPLINAAVGLKATENLNLFSFVSVSDESIDSDSEFAETVDERTISRTDIGANYKFNPRSQLWVKLGYTEIEADSETFIGSPGTVDLETRQPEFSARFTSLINEVYQFSFGVDWHQDKTTEVSLTVFPIFSFDDQIINDSAWDRKSLDIYFNNRYQVNRHLLLEAGLFYQHHEQKYTNTNDFIVQEDFGFIPSESSEKFSIDSLNYRAGLVFKFGSNRQLRLAHQRWVRPVGQNTLAPVATAGIVLDDRLTHKGGELTRTMLQLEWEWTDNTFSKLFFDHRKIENNRFTFSPFTTEESGGIFQLQNKRAARFSKEDVFEFLTPPDFIKGKVEIAGASLNRIMNRNWSLFARYAHSKSENTADSLRTSFIDCLFAAEAPHFDQLPFLPRQTAVIGSSLSFSNRLSIATQGVYRTKRYSNDANCTSLGSNWSLAADIYIESRNKMWAARAGFEQGFNRMEPTSYNVEIRIRF